MPGPVYNREGKVSSIDLLKGISNTFKLSLNNKKSAGPKEKIDNVQKGDKNHLILLLKKLGDKKSSYDDRAQCAIQVRQLLNTLDVESIPALWYSAHDLIDNDVPQPSRKAVLELLYECVIRCKEDTLKIIFFHLIMDYIVGLLLNEKPFVIDSEITLFISSLNAILQNSITMLSPEDFTELSEIVDELISTALQSEVSDSFPLFLEETIQLVNKMIGYVKNTTVKRIILLGITSLESNGNTCPNIFHVLISFLHNLAKEDMRHPLTDSIPQIVALLVLISERVSDLDDEAIILKFEQLLEIIATSSENKIFFDQFLVTNWPRSVGLFHVCEVYTKKYFVYLNSNMVGEGDYRFAQELIIAANKLHQEMKDKFLLEILVYLLDIHSLHKMNVEYEDFWLSNKPGKIGLWLLIKLIINHYTHLKTMYGSKIMGLLLRANSKFIYGDDLVQFAQLVGISIPPQCLVHIAEKKEGAELTLKTLEILIEQILIPKVAIRVRLVLWNFFIGYLKDNTEDSLLLNSDKFGLVLGIYDKSELLELDPEELFLLGNFIYEQVKYLDNDKIGILLQRVFADISQLLNTMKRRKSIVGTIETFAKRMPPSEYYSRRLTVLVQALAKSFIWSTMDKSGFKCAILYRRLIKIYEKSIHSMYTASLLDIARVMVRIRADRNGNILFRNPSDAIGISSALGRNINLRKHFDKPVKWTFPETISFLDEEHLENPNSSVFFTDSAKEIDKHINIGIWLATAIDTIEYPVDMEIYSYLLTHLCGQISEIPLFRNHHELIGKFEGVICDHLTRGIPANITVGNDLGIQDLHSAYVRNLSAVLAYYPYQPKKFADELINALVGGLTSWEKTLIPILHILTVSCFEVPLSIQRYLTSILQHIQTRITSSYAIPSILEFILALGESPKVISNLTIDEIKRVYAILFKLIENSVDLNMRSILKDQTGDRDGDPEKIHAYRLLEFEIDISTSTDTFLIRQPLIEFLYHQSFRALSSWFLRLSHNSQSELLPFITKNLSSLRGIDSLKYDAAAYLDFFSRSRFSPQSGNLPPDNSPVDQDNTISWVFNNGLISIQTFSQKNSIVNIRRPSHNMSFEISRPISAGTQPTYNIFGLESDETINEAKDSEEMIITEPDDILFQLLYTAGIEIDSKDSFLKVPNVAVFRRSICALDRILDIETQKVGIVYVGFHQNTEEDVLRNTVGSYQYHWFLNQLGSFIKLTEIPKFFYSGGLDASTDGEYALFWKDKIAQIIFHTVTLMPNDNDNISMKKRHVGNDFVNVFYDESDLPDFNFNIIKSQYTFISIVITPQTTNFDYKRDIADHYKVKMYRRTGTPGLLSCTHFKIVGKLNLASYVRHVCLIANALAQKYCENYSTDSCSIWGIRCKHLQTLKERVSKGP